MQMHDNKEPIADAGFKYLGFDYASGLHKFSDGFGPVQLFKAHLDPHDGWGLYGRGYYYEYVRRDR